MIGIESELDAKQAALSCLERGVLVLTAKNKIRLLPALNIPDGQLERAVDTLISVLKG